MKINAVIISGQQVCIFRNHGSVIRLHRNVTFSSWKRVVDMLNVVIENGLAVHNVAVTRRHGASRVSFVYNFLRRRG